MKRLKHIKLFEELILNKNKPASGDIVVSKEEGEGVIIDMDNKGVAIVDYGDGDRSTTYMVFLKNSNKKKDGKIIWNYDR